MYSVNSASVISDLSAWILTARAVRGSSFDCSLGIALESAETAFTSKSASATFTSCVFVLPRFSQRRRKDLLPPLSIVATRSVVVSDVPAYTIVGGNPAKPLKQRFPSDVIDVLQSIAWWDWSIEKITRHLDIIVSADVDALRACAADD